MNEQTNEPTNQSESDLSTSKIILENTIQTTNNTAV